MGLFNKSASAEEEPAPTGSAVKELLPPKVTLGDTINHKRYLDEAVIKVRGFFYVALTLAAQGDFQLPPWSYHTLYSSVLPLHWSFLFPF